jgi:hypothetical protein
LTTNLPTADEPTTKRATNDDRTTVRDRLEQARETHHVPERCYVHLAPADDPESPKRPDPKVGYRRVEFDDVEGRNYGVCPDGGLVILDIDDGPGPDHPRTFETSSPHNSGHLYLVSDRHVAKALRYAFGAENPGFEWGEVKGGNTKNTHVVGAGSVLDRCDKNDHECSRDGEGAYTVAEDLPITYVPADELIALLDDATDRSATIPADGFHDDGRPKGVTDPTEDTDTAYTSINGELTEADEQLIETAKNAKNGDAFDRLWRGKTTGYPSQSEADLALCGMLAFWTKRDADRMARLFDASGLSREKWKRDDYRSMTIDLAIEGCEDTHTESSSASRPGFRPETSHITRNKVFRAVMDLGVATTQHIVDHDDVDRGPRQVRRALDNMTDTGMIDHVRKGRRTYYHHGGAVLPRDRLERFDLTPSDLGLDDDSAIPRAEYETF